MGYLLPGGRFRRFGDSLVNDSIDNSVVPAVSPIAGNSLAGTQQRIATARSVTAASTDITRTAPTFNDPRYTFTTLSIPTDLRTLNGLYRFFDDTDPVVGNSIRLHSEFPLSRVQLKELGDPLIQHHFEDMWNRLQMDKLLFDIALEYWRVGNVFPFGSWNADDLMWQQFVILNPDYVTVEGTYLNQRPFIKLQPDEHLKKVVTTGQPKFLYDQLPPEIVKYVRMGQEIPLSPNNVFHLAHNKSPYETLGRSIIKRILKSLIYEDRMSMANFAIATRQTIPITVVKIGDPQSGWVPQQEELEEVREMLACHDDQTEVLTEDGFKLFKDLTKTDNVGCFNPENNQLEYHLPTKYYEYDYDKDLIHFKMGKVDVMVTPNHRMWVNTDNYCGDKGWHECRADQVHKGFNFRAVVEWEGGSPPETLEICGQLVDTKTYLRFLGWFLSEGSVSENTRKYYKKKTHEEHVYKVPRIQIAQQVGVGADDIRDVLDKLAFPYNEHKYKTSHGTEYCKFNITRKFGKFMFERFEGGFKHKYVPREILSYDKVHLEILLDSLMQGDGNTRIKDGVTYCDYTTGSKQLADDVCEIALKLGFAPVIARKKFENENWADSYRVRFSTSKVGRFPSICVTRSSGAEPIRKVPYKGKVYCLEVPTDLLVTRRGGKLLVSGNSREIDPNFCYDNETECLTDGGWVKFPEITFDHKIASFNPDGNKLEYYHPQAITVQDYDGDMIHFHSRKIDCKVTPNHRMFVERGGKWQVVYAENVLETDVFRNCVDTYESTSLPDEIEVAGTKVNTGDFFEFIGWHVSEGSVGGFGHDGKDYRVQITQTPKGSFSSVEKLMSKLPWKYALYDKIQFTINSKALTEYLVKTFDRGSNKKSLPRWVLDAPPYLLERLFTSYIEGDGTAIKTKRGVFYQAHTASQELADNLQEIGIKLGYAVSLQKRDDVYFKWGGKKEVGTHRDGERHYTRPDGENYFDMYRLNFSKDSVSRFPKLRRRKDYKPVFKQEPVLVGKVSKKGKRIDWDNVDLKEILVQTEGYAAQAAKLLGYSVGTVLNQMSKIGISPQKEGTRASKYEDTGNIQRVPYKGKIGCVSVPTGIIITRRNGYPIIAGQTIVYHWGIDVQFYGASGKIWNLTREFDRIMKWKLLGLGISEAILSGGSSYASAYAQLEVLRQRYLYFQNTLQNFVYRGVFEPVARACGFYKTVSTVAGRYYQGAKYGEPAFDDLLNDHIEKYSGEMSKRFVDRLQRRPDEKDITLVYPELDWDLLSLSNDVQYRNFLMNFDRLFPGQRKVSDDTFYKAAKLNQDAEKAKLISEHEKELEHQLKKAKVTEEYRKKFADEGLPFPADTAGKQLGESTTPGPGGMGLAPGEVPPLGGTGGGNLPGAPATVPNAPIGKNRFVGTPPRTPAAIPVTPEASRLRSKQLHEQLVGVSSEIEKGNLEETERLRKFNKDSGVGVDKIKQEAESDVEPPAESF